MISSTAIAAFLRPLDLTQILFVSCSILDTNCLLFCIVTPKETQGKWRTIKPFTVHPHADDIKLCPIQCFKAIRDHPALKARLVDSKLFLNSSHLQQPLSKATISTWLHRDFIALCTSEHGISTRLLTSSRSLDLGVPRDSITALGNWASSDTFVLHYQQNQMA